MTTKKQNQAAEQQTAEPVVTEPEQQTTPPAPPAAAPKPAGREFVDINIHPMTGEHLFKKVFSSEGPIFAGRGAEVSAADAAELCDGARKMCRRITREELAAENAARRNPDAESE